MGFMFYALALLWFRSRDGAMMTSCDMLASSQTEIQGECEVAVAHPLPYVAVADDGCTPLLVAGRRWGAVPALTLASQQLTLTRAWDALDNFLMCTKRIN